MNVGHPLSVLNFSFLTLPPLAKKEPTKEELQQATNRLIQLFEKNLPKVYKVDSNKAMKNIKILVADPRLALESRSRLICLEDDLCHLPSIFQ